MYESIRKAYGAVSKKGVSSILTMMRIKKGLVIGTDGNLTIGVGVPELKHLDITVPADKFLKAISIADLSKIKLKVTAGGKLSIVAGKFRVLIPTVPNESFPEVTTSGDLIQCEGILQALKVVSPFIGDDAIRKWSNGARLTDNYIYCTNNVTIVKYKVNMSVPEIIIPRATVHELLRIGEEPIGVVADTASITFILENDCWINSKIIDGKWPDVEQLFQDTENLPPVHPELLEAVSSVTPFCADSKFPAILFSEEGISTKDGDMSSSYSGIKLPHSSFHATVLTLLLPSIETIDWGRYPKPCPFQGVGGKLQGAVMGLLM